MRVLIKKIKRTNKIELTLYLTSVLYYLISYILFTICVLKLKKIETVIRIILLVFFGLYFIYYFLSNLVNLITKKHHKFFILMLITIIFSLVFTVGTYYINEIYHSLNKFGERNKINYTTNLITLSKNEFTSESTIGIISNKEDIEGYILPQELIEKKKLKNSVVTYNDYFSMMKALFDEKVDAIFVSSNYITIFQNEDEYSDLANDTKVIHKLTKEMKNKDLELKSEKSLNEPFTILIMGVDSEKDGLNANAAFNGDTLMLITFNPKTLNATIFSIPRDTYVPIACRRNAENKINSSAAYGTKCVIDTIENLTDIKIDYYIKINFKGVVNLIDSLGGIDVDVPIKFCEQDSERRFGEYEICLDKGYQHLNGEQALAFARHRHSLLRGDIDRTKHQQLVIEAIAKKMLKKVSFSDFKEILDSISDNIATNIETEQILSFYDTIKQMLLNSLNGEDLVTIEKTYLEYYDLPIYTSYGYMSAIGYYESSLEAIRDAMKMNLGIKKITLNKSFSYDYNQEYEQKIIGKGLTSGNTIETLPDFRGQTISDVINWLGDKQIIVNYEYVDHTNQKYNSSYENGYIANQSVTSRTRVSDIKEITIYINK